MATSAYECPTGTSLIQRLKNVLASIEPILNKKTAIKANAFKLLNCFVIESMLQHDKLVIYCQ